MGGLTTFMMTRVTSLPFLNHFIYGSACGAMRSNIFDHPDSNGAPIILQEEYLSGFQYLVDLNQSTAKPMGGEICWFAGACNAVDFVVMPPNPHVSYTGQHRTNGVFF